MVNAEKETTDEWEVNFVKKNILLHIDNFLMWYFETKKEGLNLCLVHLWHISQGKHFIH